MPCLKLYQTGHDQPLNIVVFSAGLYEQVFGLDAPDLPWTFYKLQLI